MRGGRHHTERDATYGRGPGEGLGWNEAKNQPVEISLRDLTPDLTCPPKMANSLLTTLKLVLVIAIVAGGAYVATLLLASINDAVKCDLLFPLAQFGPHAALRVIGKGRRSSQAVASASTRTGEYPRPRYAISHNVGIASVAVKTDRRAMTQEQTQDKLQSSIMRAWKATQFNVPGVLKGTRLAGSAHDKNKADYDAKSASLLRSLPVLFVPLRFPLVPYPSNSATKLNFCPFRRLKNLPQVQESSRMISRRASITNHRFEVIRRVLATAYFFRDFI